MVLDQGKIIEMGTHEELLKREGKYYDLFMEQYGKVNFTGGTANAIMKWRTRNVKQDKKNEEQEKEKISI